MAGQKVRAVLLATDSAEAAELFTRELGPEGLNVELHVASNFDRDMLSTPADHLKNGRPTTENWIEYRSMRDLKFGAMAAHSALEDLRLLAQGQLIIGGFCSSFTKAAYASMLANNGGEVTTISLDRCNPARDSCDASLAPWDTRQNI